VKQPVTISFIRRIIIKEFRMFLQSEKREEKEGKKI
jgi:hypothetical protein